MHKRTIRLGVETENYILTLSKRRKTISIIIDKECGLKVYAPSNADINNIEDFMQSKAHWINTKMEKVRALNLRESSLEFLPGDYFGLLGKKYILIFMNSEINLSPYIRFDGNHLLFCHSGSINEDDLPFIVKKALFEWYKKTAAVIIQKQLDLYSTKMDVKPSALKIKNQKTIWGSCTARNVININWKIITAPLEIIDYLIVHELAHIKVRNHSKTFWNVVKSILPDYKKRKQWLKEHGDTLGFRYP